MKNKLAKFPGIFTTVAMLVSMAITAPPALANVSTPTVTISPAVVGNNATYDVRFAVTRQLTQNGAITITFPSGTGVLEGNVTGNCTITASPGLMGEALRDADVTGLQFTGDNTSHRIVIGLNATGNRIGEGSQIKVVLGSGVIRNPTSPGNYSLTVSTSNETTAITSAVYAITLPIRSPLPGIVTGKNSAGQVLYLEITNDVNGAINTTGVTRVEVGLGTYNATIFPKANQTIIATGAAGSVMLTSGTPNLPAVSIMADNVTLDGFTISPAIPGGQTAVIITGDNATIRNVTFNKGDYQLGVAAENATRGTTIDNCIFNVTDNVTMGLLALSTTLVTNCTFNVDADSAGIVAGGNVTLAGSRFLGAGSTGAGIYVTSGTSTISSSNFNAMGNDVLAVSGNATLKVTGNTITSSGLTAASENSGVITAYGGNLILADNIIRDSSPANYALHISGGNVTASFNNIIGNVLNVRQTNGLANVTHNWWGFLTGPTSASINGTVSYAPFLNAAVTGGRIALNTDKLTERTSPVGVEVTCTNATTGNPTVAGIIAAAKYASNPLAVAPPGSPWAYYEVFVSGPASGSTVAIKFYNQVFADYSRVYFVGPTGNWSEVGIQGVNVTGRYAYVMLTDTSVPAVKDLSGTIFALTTVNAPPVAPHPPPPPFNPLHDKGTPPPAGIGGWEKPRPLTDAEKARVIEIAVNISASAWLQGRTDYRVSGVGWYAAIWNGSESVARWMCSYDIINTGIPGYVNPYAYWYPAVTIYSPVGMQMQIAINLDNGGTAFVDGPYHPPGQITVSPPQKPNFQLAVNTTGLGFAKGAGIYAPVTTATVTANPEPGWQFAGWTGDAVADAGAANTTIMMTGDKSITAHFEVIPPTPDNATSPNTSGNNTSSTPASNWPLWLVIALGAIVVLVATILFLKSKRN